MPQALDLTRNQQLILREVAVQQFDFLLSKMEDLVNVEQRPTMEGRAMAAIVSPKPGVLHKLAQERILRERQAQQASAAGHKFPQEIESFYRTIAYDTPSETDSLLAADSISTIYSAYVSADKQGTASELKTY